MVHKQKKLTRTEIGSLRKLLKRDWKTPYSNKLTLELTFTDFMDAVDFVNKIADVAESQNHHPDISIYSYKNVYIEIFTHELDGLTYKDFDLAKEIERLLA